MTQGLSPLELPPLESFIDRDLQKVRQEFSGTLEEGSTQTQFDKIVEIAMKAVGATTVCYAAKGYPTLPNGTQLMIYLKKEGETHIIEGIEKKEGAKYRSVLQAKDSTDPDDKALYAGFVVRGGATIVPKALLEKEGIT